MAYSRKIRNAARTIWLLGYSDEKILQALKKQFPDEATPSRYQTIITWRQSEEWEKDLPAIEQKANEKRIESVVDALRQEELEDIKTLQLAISHVRTNLTKRNRDGQAIPVTLKEANQAAAALDKLMRRKRINRYGYDVLTIKDLESIEIDSTPESVGEE